ncbi:Enterochelin esterase [Georgenia satyanarayanai]|uniref:Acyl-CoA:diacylglycerol acyltransferase n=1 Tax=Georgenia satyanarayanai TaxID=860221 RepID=A0A2Y9AKY7_9MICO|nr:alpha/beta hydrolase-fold protein [Georgenia satyanarayanai]PYF98449.1 enterochelin esterase-like enzyme [Georgenia satyanarayanai]SSA45124.1 Enterochelin esterase [Georgenia satyanarayanai]
MRHHDVRHRSRTRRGVGALASAALVGAGLVAAGSGAAAAEDPWIWEPAEDLHRFSIPDAAVQEATGQATPDVVAVAGNFGPGKTWAQLNTGLSGGTWNATIGPLEPGLYYYQYEAVVDGEVIGFDNPDVPQQVTSKPTWNTFFVPGESAQWLADVPTGGQVETIGYESTVTEDERSALVWTPPGYDAERTEPYPVLYLLQDEGQSHREWAELGRAVQILDNLAVEGEIEPMVVVMGDGSVGDARAEVLDNLLPAARDGFNVSDDPADQAIAGIGRGASQALNLLLTDTGEFSHVGSLSGSLVSSISARKAEQVNESTDLLRLYVGNTTDPAYNRTVSLLDKLDAAGVDHQFDGVTPGSGGTWDTWQQNLHDFAPRLFQDVADDGPSEGHLPVDGLHSLPEPGTTPTPWIDENGIVTFETGTEFADAKDVRIWANWGAQGNWLRIPLVKHGDRWRLTLGPLEGGSYYYKLIVDGVDHKDTANPTSVVSEPNWSTFYVPGDGIRGEYTGNVPADQRGDVEVMTYTSTAGEQERSAYVWTPPDYDPGREEPYPVFFLQHGGGQTWADWVEVGFAPQILDNHYRKGTIVPMVVVMANGNGVNYPNEILQRLVPAVESEYHVSSDPEDRALAGLSMGSGHAMSTLYTHPGEFAYIGAFSAFSAPPADADVEAINAGTTLLRVYSGDIQDFTYQATLGMIAGLTERGIDHEFASIIPGPHSWDVWQKSLIDFLPRLFAADTSAGIPVEAEIPEREDGVLALTVGDYGDAVGLSEPDHRGDRLRLTGALPDITVSDSRTAQQAGVGGWSVTGQADSFTSGGRSITADHLGWVPSVLTPRPGVTAGSRVATSLDDGPGLAAAATLASADREGRHGSTTLGAALVLDTPVDTEPGAYTSSVYVSLFPVD